MTGAAGGVLLRRYYVRLMSKDGASVHYLRGTMEHELRPVPEIYRCPDRPVPHRRGRGDRHRRRWRQGLDNERRARLVAPGHTFYRSAVGTPGLRVRSRRMRCRSVERGMVLLPPRCLPVQRRWGQSFSGTLEFGYQVGIPWSVGQMSTSSHTTPNALLYDVPITQPTYSVITPYLLPGATISTDIGNGPGVQELITFSVPVSGADGAVAIANAHGTVTGVAGGVQVRAFARLTWPDHASITTYGELWNVD